MSDLLSAAQALHDLNVEMSIDYQALLAGMGYRRCPVCRKMVDDLPLHASGREDPEHAVVAVMEA